MELEKQQLTWLKCFEAGFRRRPPEVHLVHAIERCMESKPFVVGDGHKKSHIGPGRNYFGTYQLCSSCSTISGEPRYSAMIPVAQIFPLSGTVPTFPRSSPQISSVNTGLG